MKAQTEQFDWPDALSLVEQSQSIFRRGRCHIKPFKHLKVRLSESVSSFEVSCALQVGL